MKRGSIATGSAVPDDSRARPELPGLDLGRLAGYLRAEGLAVGDRLTARLIAGGRSNLTYLVEDGTAGWVLRRPPVGDLLATAHDMGREYRVMSALAPTTVPVPRMQLLCTDPAVLGAPFFLMEFVAGTPFRRAAELAILGPSRTEAIAGRVVDTLALLHAVEPAAVGLADFGRPDGFLPRQVERWGLQLAAVRTRDLPTADQLLRRLSAAVPAAAPSWSAGAIVHGDFRIDNVLVDAEDRVAAVLDWELATLGDPLTDLALMIVYQRAAPMIGMVTDAAAAPGYPDEDRIVQRYETASGREVHDFGLYVALAAFKLAVIAEGVHARHLGGQTVGEGFDRIGEAVEPVLALGLDAIGARR